MLHLSLLPSLLLPALAANAPVDELGRAIPDDAPIVIRASDLFALMTGDDAGQWARFVSDPRLLALLSEAAAEEGAELEAMMPILTSLAAGLHGAVCYGYGDDRVGGVLQAEEGWLQRVLDEAAAAEMPFEALELAGGPAYRSADASPLFLAPRGDRVLVHAGDGDAELALAAIATRLADPSRSGAGWWTNVASRVDDAAVEVFVDLQALGEVDAQFEEFFGSKAVMYLGGALGEGRHADAVVALELAEGSMLGAVASVLTPADAGMLRHVPEGYYGSVVGLDVMAAVEALVDFADAQEPGARAQYDEGLDSLVQMLGIDLEADVLASLSGQILMVSPLLDYAEVFMAVEREDAAGLISGMAPTLALGLTDADALLDVVTKLVDIVESQGLEVYSSELDGATVWTFEAMPGAEIGVAIGHGLLTVGSDAGVAALLRTSAHADAPRGHSDAEIAAMDAEFDGCLLSVVGVDGVLEVMDSLLGSMDQMGEQLEREGASEEELANFQVAREMLPDFLGIARDHLSGSLGTSIDITDRGVVLRLICR